MAEIEDNIDYRIDVSDKIPPFSRIPSEIRGKNPEFYEPAIIAIGPCHREDESGGMKIALQRMEFVKAEYLNDLCKRHPANKLETYREEIRKSGEKAMMSYSTISSTYKSKSDKDENTSKFLEMLLMDGCFIVEFLLKKEEERRKTEKQQKAAPEPYQQPKEGINLTAMTFQRRIMPMLRRDLLLFENQIPFFILETIFKHTNHNISREDGGGGVTILYLVLRYLSKGRIKVQEGTNFKSLLHISQYYQHSDPDPPDSSDLATYTFSDSFSFTEKVVIALLAVVFIWIWPFFYVSEKKKRKSNSKERMIPTATKLKQVGVRFEVSTTARYTSSLKVSFEDEGIMKIPKLIIDPDTISEYSNLLAFEQTRDDYNDKFTKLMVLMDSLVDTADDVDLLKNSKIIDSRLSSQEVASFFSLQMIDKKMDPSSTAIPFYRAPNSPSSSSFSWFEIRLFSIRISPCIPDMVPSHISLSHPRRETGVSLEINGTRFPASDPTTVLLRLDRLDKSASEVTYVSTDSVRFTGPVEFEVRDSNDLVLCGAFDRLDPSWINDTIRHDKDSKTGWCMDCYCAAGVAASSFVQPKKGIATPFMEVYVAGSCSGRPLILTQMVQVNPRKAIKQGILDVIPEDDDDAMTDRGQCVVRRRPVLPLVEGGDSDGNDSEMKFGHGLYADGQFYDEDGELTWFNSGVRVGVGIGLGMCLGVGIGVGLLMNSYQATARNLRRRFF